MAAVPKLKLKRLFSELPPDTLILEASSKHPAKRLHYVRDNTEERRRSESARRPQTPAAEQQPHPHQQLAAIQHTQQQLETPRVTPKKPVIEKKRRIFQLNHVPAQTSGQKRGRSDDDLATFEEKRTKSEHVRSNGISSDASQTASAPAPVQQPLKRPGRGAATVKRPTQLPTPSGPSMAEQQQIQELAAYMHEAAMLEEDFGQRASPRKPNNLSHTRHRNSSSQQSAVPKLSGERSRALHRQRAMTNGSTRSMWDTNGSMADESEWVYDTYILAPATTASSYYESTLPSNGQLQQDQEEQQEHLAGLDNVGYLVIGSEDESVWETYMEDELSDADGRSDAAGDDEDENAEDFYGADYPEDELDSDDEFGRAAYGYRGRRGSDVEEWDFNDEADDDGAEWSDGEKDYDRMMNPFGRSTGAVAARKWAKYLDQGGQIGVRNDDDEEGDVGYLGVSRR